MARPYSQDLRDRVVASVVRGRTCRATAALFGVSVASVVKWSQRWRASGSAAAKPMGGWRPLRLQRERAWLLAHRAEKPDLTLRALMAELAECGTPASDGAVWRFFKHEGITFKKTVYASEQDRADIARRRTRWKMHQGRLDPRRLVFIDETWAKTNMTRRHGRCRRGARLVAEVPQGRWRILTFLAALRHDRITAPCVIDGPINGASFRAYVEQFLVPPSAPATSSSWTISAVIRARPCAAQSAPPAPSCSSCLATRPISIRSSRSSPSSRPCCAKPTRARSRPLGAASAISSATSPHRNAPTTSQTPAMLQPNRITL